MLVDRLGRKIDTLRLSVTDLCNLRCRYCIPADGILKMRHSEILTFEEIVRLVRILSRLGVRRVRLTGGEPLVRRGIVDLLRCLKGILGIQEVLLTTNGLLLKPLAEGLKEAGLERINIHLDTLDAEKFYRITRGGDLSAVFEGIEEARRVGFHPIKVNMVLQKGFNDGEVEELVRFAAERDLIPRFIELMPIGEARTRISSFIPAAEIRRRLEVGAYGHTPLRLDPVEDRLGTGPAVYYRVAELGTVVGFISPVSQPFCEGCNRIRISADGRFQDCLAYDGRFSLRDLLRDPGMSDNAIAQGVLERIRGKRGDHGDFAAEEVAPTPWMYGIGG